MGSRIRWFAFGSVLAIAGVLASPTALARASSPFIQHLGTLGGDQSFALGINDHTAVVGYSAAANGLQHAFLWRRGRMIDLGVAPSGISIATAINERGQVVGYSSSPSSTCPCHGFLLRNGVLTDLGGLGGDRTIPRALNDRGDVVGGATTPDGAIHAFLWHDGVLTDLGVGTGEAQGINKQRQVVGGTMLGRAFLWEDGVLTDLGLPPGMAFAGAFRINDRAQVIGTASPAGIKAAMAFVWEDGAFTDLGSLGDRINIPRAINNRGDIVGNSGGVAFLWHAGTLTDLGTLLPIGSGWTSLVPTGINNSGQIVGVGSLTGIGTRAFLMRDPLGRDDDREEDQGSGVEGQE